MRAALESLVDAVRGADLLVRQGRVSQLVGLLMESDGPDVFLGEECQVHLRQGAGRSIPAEVVGFKSGKVLLMPYGDISGISLGSLVFSSGKRSEGAVGEDLCGRIVDAMGVPLDKLPPPDCKSLRLLVPQPMNPMDRVPIGEIIETGVKSIDAMMTLGRGQRIGIFAGSGVGKSTLLGMIAGNVDADVVVIAMIGERGREVRDFVEHTLGEDGLRRAVLVVSTSDQPPLLRVRAAHLATSIAEFFRDEGKDVLLIMDSLTRYAMAMRDIGLAVGEPPTARGYTPSVFTSLPRLVERCGTVASGGSITAIYTVLVEGDDLNDPIGDAARAILDGHIALSREMANHGHFPAIDILKSGSRLMPTLVESNEMALIHRILGVLGTYQKNRDLIEIGAYREGTTPDIDEAIKLTPVIEKFFRQGLREHLGRQESLRQLSALTGFGDEVAQ